MQTDPDLQILDYILKELQRPIAGTCSVWLMKGQRACAVGAVPLVNYPGQNNGLAHCISLSSIVLCVAKEYCITWHHAAAFLDTKSCNSTHLHCQGLCNRKQTPKSRQLCSPNAATLGPSLGYSVASIQHRSDSRKREGTRS